MVKTAALGASPRSTKCCEAIPEAIAKSKEQGFPMQRFEMRRLTRGDSAIMWIEKFCVYPNGAERGQHVSLRQGQKEIVRRAYDRPNGLVGSRICGHLAAYMALLHVCGPEALRNDDPGPQFYTDSLQVWAATSPDLKEVLKRDGEAIVCPELGTRYPAAA
jgi:hypothetical protein